MTGLLSTPPATGVVLAGGASSRLGRDKALESVNGKPMLAHVVESLDVICSQVLVAGDPKGREAISLPQGVRWISDRYVEKGPLAGLHAGLSEAEHDLIVAVACDMPLINGMLLALLLRTAQEGQGLYDAVVPRVGGRLQTLHAVYARSSVRQAEELLTTESRPSLHDLVSRLKVRYVDEEELRLFDRDLRSFLSVNTEDDLDRLNKLLGRESP